MDLKAGQLTRRMYSGLTQWTNSAYEESWTFADMTLSEMPDSALLTIVRVYKLYLLTYLNYYLLTNQPPLSSIIKSHSCIRPQNILYC